MQLTSKDIFGELNGMIFIYPNCGHSEATVGLCVPAYLEACAKADMDKKDFVEACSYVRQNCTYFPTPAHIVKAHRVLMATRKAPRRDVLSIPPVMSDERAEKNKEWCKKILSKICGSSRMPQEVKTNGY